MCLRILGWHIQHHCISQHSSRKYILHITTILCFTPCCNYTLTQTYNMQTRAGSSVLAKRSLRLSNTLHCYSEQMETRFHLNTSLRFLRLNPICQSEKPVWAHMSEASASTVFQTHMLHMHIYTCMHSPRSSHPQCDIDMKAILMFLFELELLDCIRYSSLQKCFHGVALRWQE